MASTAAERQKERHNRMLEKGFRKRAFYVNEDTLRNLTEYKEANNLDSLDEALNQLINAASKRRMKIEVTLFGSSEHTRKRIIKQYASLESTISFDDAQKISVFACEHSEAMRLCINLPPRVAKYNWQTNELYVDLNAFSLSGNDGWNNITQSSILSKDARQ